MRFVQENQLWLSSSSPELSTEKNPVIQELKEMSNVLDSCPGISEVLNSVKRDLVGDRRDDCGARGLSAEQALRAGVVKEKLGLSYRDLEFYLVDSMSLRSFVRLDPMKRVSKSVLNRDIRLISEQTWELFNDCLKNYAKEHGIEDGSCIRGDTTATETNIHYPTNSSLLYDCIRVLTRLLEDAQKLFPGLRLKYSNHNRRTKKRLYKINNTKDTDKRRGEYRDLIRICEWTQSYVDAALATIHALPASDTVAFAKQCSLIEDLKHYRELSEKVLAQTIRRELNGEQVPVAEKIVSIFEPHTDIIEKRYRDTTFGHKVCLTNGRSGLILDCMILEGNPKDSTLVNSVLSRHTQFYRRAPEQVAFDGGFASLQNARSAKEQGVKEVAFSKAQMFQVDAFVSSSKIFKALINFRAGIEGGISALKRSWGFNRVMAKGWRAFKNSLLNAVTAFNLTLLARQLLQRA